LSGAQGGWPSAAAIADAGRAGRRRASDVIEDVLRRADETEARVGAYLLRTDEAARERAVEIDAAAARGVDPGPLAGCPIAIKDNLCVRGLATTAGSRILEGYVPPYSATAVTRLLESGAVLIGKTNLDEFAMGSSTERSAFQTTRNPWALDRVPGGSSGGSAAAVAAGSAVCALGSDTGGSIRQPAAFCGVVGLKPTYGLVSRYGLLAFASSLDQVGPLGRSVEGCARLLDAIAGHDPRDATSRPDEDRPSFAASLRRFPAGLRVGLAREHLGAATEPGVRAVCDRAIETLRGLGAEIVDVSLPHTRYGIATYYVVATAEASSNLARYDGVHYGHRTAHADGLVSLYGRSRGEGFGPEVKRRIFLGTYALSSGYYDAYYLRALKVRTLIRRDFDAAFARCDVLCGPTSPTTAFPIGARTDDPLSMYAADVLTVGANLAGIPGLSVPAGLSPQNGLPVGLQLLAPIGRDGLLLQVGHGFEAARGPLPRALLADRVAQADRATKDAP